MKLAYQQRQHRKAVRQAKKVYAYYLEHTATQSQDEIGRHFGHNREWLRQQIIRAQKAEKEAQE